MSRRRYVTVTENDTVELVEMPRRGRSMLAAVLIALLLLLTLSTCSATAPNGGNTLTNLVSVLTGGRVGALSSSGGLRYGSGDTSTNGQPGGAIVTLSPSPGPMGSPGPSGPPGPAGSRGPQGDTATISLGTGSGGITACDSDVHVSLRSAYVNNQFLLQSITLRDVAAACDGLDFTVYLTDAADNTLLVTHAGSVAVTSTGRIVLQADTTTHEWTTLDGTTTTVLSPDVAYLAMELAS